jgi:hypothetical protein
VRGNHWNKNGANGGKDERLQQKIARTKRCNVSIDNTNLSASSERRRKNIVTNKPRYGRRKLGDSEDGSSTEHTMLTQMPKQHGAKGLYGHIVAGCRFSLLRLFVSS